MTAPGTRRCGMCGRRLRAPSRDGLGPVCRRKNRATPGPDVSRAPAVPLDHHGRHSAGQLTLEEPVPQPDRPAWQTPYGPAHRSPMTTPERVEPVSLGSPPSQVALGIGRPITPSRLGLRRIAWCFRRSPCHSSSNGGANTAQQSRDGADKFRSRDTSQLDDRHESQPERKDYATPQHRGSRPRRGYRRGARVRPNRATVALRRSYKRATHPDIQQSPGEPTSEHPDIDHVTPPATVDPHRPHGEPGVTLLRPWTCHRARAPIRQDRGARPQVITTVPPPSTTEDTVTTTATPQQHLARIVTLWPHLDDMLDTHHAAPWPPAGRMADYLKQLDQADAEQVQQARELEVPAGAPPLRLAILDTARAVERVLLDTADQIASTVQRPAARALPAAPGDAIGLRLRMAALADQADRSRWSWTARETRTAVHAAVWLSHRLDAAPGPFRSLTVLQREHIERVAVGARERIESALDLVRRRTAVTHPCPHCRGGLEVHGGDGQAPAVQCDGCGWTRTTDTTAA